MVGDGDGIVTGSAGRSSSWSRDKVTGDKQATGNGQAGGGRGRGDWDGIGC